MSLRVIRRALLSVSDKSGLVDLARVLVEQGVELISTGGTRKALADAGLPVKDIAEVTGFPEMLEAGSRHCTRASTAASSPSATTPSIRRPSTSTTSSRSTWSSCNLYPFEATVAKAGSTHEDIIENIDIGGPSMVRSAAKNHHDVAIVCDPRSTREVLDELTREHGALALRNAGPTWPRPPSHAPPPTTRPSRRTSHGSTGGGRLPDPSRPRLREEAGAALRREPAPAGRVLRRAGRPACRASPRAEMLHGKELSYNNLLDLDAP